MTRRRTRLATALAALAALAVTLPACAETKASGGHGIDFGVVGIDFPSDQDFQLMKQGNVGIFRFAVYWPVVQPSPGACSAGMGSACNWAPFDQLATRAAENNIPLLLDLYATPNWASHRDGPRAIRYDPMRTKAGRHGWKDFVAAVVNRYKPGGEFWKENPSLTPDPVRHWQVWNEQNSSSQFKPTPSARAYAKLLKATSHQIRKAQPGADVLLGGMFGTPEGSGVPSQTSWGFLQQLYKVPGIRPSFDAVAVHPYSPGLRGIRYQLNRISKVLRRNHDSARTWITELGWGSDAKHVDNPLVKTRRGQRNLLKRSFHMLEKHRRRWRIAGVTWFSWRDPVPSSSTCGFCPSSGLFTKALRPKPSWKAFKSFTTGN